MDPSDAANAEFWAHEAPVAAYTDRNLRAAEILVLVRYREDLSGRVIEVGCGAGRVIGHLTQTAAEAYGADVSAEMVAYCRTAYPRGTFIEADMRNVDELEQAPFDAILATFNVLDAIGDGDRHRTLDAFHSALVTGGLLVMSAHNRAYAPQMTGPAGEVLEHLRARKVRPLVRSSISLPRRVRNRRKVLPHEAELGDHALINDPAHEYSLLHYYMFREDQEKQLAGHGFEVLECLDLEGNALPQGERAPYCSELHYVCRRSA